MVTTTPSRNGKESTMGTEIEKHTGESVLSNNLHFTNEQIDTLKRTLCKGITTEELDLYLNVCKSRGLNPFACQIYAVKRWSNAEKREIMSIQTGIAGFRSIALYTGQYGGPSGTVFFDEEGKEYPRIWLKKEHPFACEVGVLKVMGKREDGSPILQEYRTLVYWDSVVQTRSAAKGGGPTEMWTGTSGVQQLEKCTEAAVLRKAFPEKLGGVYEHAEMQHLDGERGEERRKKSEQTIDFVKSLPEEMTKRLVSLGCVNEAKKLAFCQDAGNTLDGISLHMDALDFARSLDEETKNLIRSSGVKSEGEVRRMLVKLGRKNWVKETLIKYLSGEAIEEVAP